MSSANVRNIQALVDLKAALVRYKSDAQASLFAARQEIQREQDWLAERERYWQREVQRAEVFMRQTQAALARCQASGYRDKDGRYYPPNCSKQEHELAQAQQQLQAAQRELQTTQQALRAVQQQAAEFQRQAQRLQSVLENDVAKAIALLERKIAILQGYVGDRAPTAEEINAAVSAVLRTTGTGNLSAAIGGAAFEEWAIANVFHDKQRIRVPLVLNEHLRKFDEEGLGLLKDRVSDNYVDVDGSLWDAKAYDENSVIDLEQLRDYRIMADAGEVTDAKGNKVPINSVNYLFSNRAAAEKNADYMEGYVKFWYVDWNADGSGTLRLIE